MSIRWSTGESLLRCRPYRCGTRVWKACRAQGGRKVPAGRESSWSGLEACSRRIAVTGAARTRCRRLVRRRSARRLRPRVRHGINGSWDGWGSEKPAVPFYPVRSCQNAPGISVKVREREGTRQTLSRVPHRHGLRAGRSVTARIIWRAGIGYLLRRSRFAGVTSRSYS